MGEKCEGDGKVDDVMLPGFRFHPTDEELVGFYLRWKIQGRALPIELIKQVDIYKYDPWDLPKFATTGEKEWYFYCPRGRKYRNSARPNRVTGAGFWKATGTDRPIYSSEGTKCVGLKKSLVFYRGRAARGIKTDWMMHEFRLPSVATDSNPPNNKFFDRNIPPNDSWAICRIFKKANSMAQQRALSHNWPLQFPQSVGSDPLGLGAQFSSKNISCTSDVGSAIQLGPGCNDDLQHSNTYFSTMDVHSYRSDVPNACISSCLPVSNGEVLNNFILSPLTVLEPTKCSVDTSSLILGPAILTDVSKASEGIDFGGPQQFMGGFSVGLASDLQPSTDTNVGGEETGTRKNLVRAQGGSHVSMAFPFSLPSATLWDSPQCPSDISTSFSTNKCYS